MTRRIISSNYHTQTLSRTSVRSALDLRLLAKVSLIILAVLLAYFGALRSGFIWDDDLLLTNNRIIVAPDGLYRFWCTTESIDYWPMTNTTFWLEWRLWRMNPTGYHVTNLILHIIESLLIWIILRKLCIPGAFWAAMIFALHPVNVESVTWISSRKNLMAMLFFLLSILWYLKMEIRSPFSQNGLYRIASPPAPRPSLLWYWLSLAAFVLAMLSKGSVAVLPVLLLGIIWWLRPLTRWDLMRISPFLVVAAVLAGVNMWFQTHGTGEVIRSVTFMQRLLGAGGIVWFYFSKALLPFGLVFVYPQWNIEVSNPLWWLPLIAVLFVTVVLWAYRKSWSRPFLFAWGFFCVALVPVIGFTDVFFMRYSLVADHYQHIAIVGIIALVSALWSIYYKRATGSLHLAAGLAAIAPLAVLAFLTWQQNRLYNDEITLYQDTLKNNPNCWMAHSNLGKLLCDKRQFQEAIEHFQQALRLKPDYVEALYNMGNTLLQKGQPQEAIEYYEKALLFKPNYIDAHNNLGITLERIGRYQEAIEQYKQALRVNPNYTDAYYNMANALLQAGYPQEAIDNYQQVLRLNPDDPEAHNSLGVAMARIGRLQEAIEHYKQALQLKPDFTEAHNNLGNALLQAGRPQEAIEHCEQALRLKPDYPEAYCNLGIALSRIGRFQEAIDNYEQALRLKIDYPEAHNNLGNALSRTGRPKEAIKHYEQALSLKPDYPEAHNNLGSVLFQTNQPQEAIEHYKQAIRLKPDYVSAYYNLGKVFKSIGQSAEAIAASRKALDFAQFQGLTAQAKEIEGWLNAYQGTVDSGQGTGDK